MFLERLSTSDAASWVEAIGTVLALVVAFKVGNRQSKASHVLAEKQAKDQRADRIAQLKAIAGSVNAPFEVAVLMVELALGSTTGGAAPNRRDGVEAARNVLQQLMLLPLPAEAYLPLSRLTMAMDRMLPLCDAAARGLITAHTGIEQTLATAKSEFILGKNGLEAIA